MYEVYVQEKKGRPALAIVASAGMLGLSVLMALGVVADRHIVPDTELGQRFALGSWPISIRCPRGWVPLGGMGSASGFVFLENVPHAGRRQLEVKRYGLHAFEPPSVYTQPDLLSRMLGVPSSAIEEHYRDLGPQPLGKFPGSMVVVGRLAIHVGVTPTGSIYKVMLDSPTGITPAEIRLLQDVTASIECHDPVILDDPSEVWKTAPFRFDVPQGTRFAVAAEPDSDHVICFGNPEEEAWQIESRLTFLAPGRSPADLVRDFISRAQLGMEPENIEAAGRADDVWARGRYGGSDETETERTVSVRALEGGTALMLWGTSDADGRDALRRAEEVILQSARLTVETPDLTTETERGRRLARRVAADVTGQWSRRDQVFWYLILRDDSPKGFYRVIRRAGLRQGREGFYFDTAHFYGNGQAAVRGRGISFVPFEGNGVALSGRGERRSGDRIARWHLVESRTDGGASLNHEWVLDDETTVSRDIELDGAYLADPLPEWAFYVIATEAAADESFLVSSSGYSMVHDAFWMRVRPIPDGDGLGVVVTHDYDPAPEEWYFDPQGNLREVRFGERQTLIACTQNDVLVRFRDARHVLAEMDAWWERR